MTAVQDLLGRDTITVVHRTAGVDDRGNDTWTETTVDVARCTVQPVDSTEALAGQDQVTSLWRLSGPADMELAAIDEVQWQGNRYEVVGDPGVHRSFGGLLDHTEAVLRRVTG